MKPFLNEDFLLQNETARYLFHAHAVSMPIIDYHCHLSPELIAKDHRFENLTQAWLYGDHYKWRAMRANGIDEHYITGKASDLEKFEKWAETVPYTMRNPLYHWTHLELQRYFNESRLLSCPDSTGSPGTSHSIYNTASEQLTQPSHSVRGLLEMMNVKVVCTTDDPVDSLEWHRQIDASGWKVKVLPTWRPDKVTNINDPESWNAYIDRLGEVAGIPISSYEDLLKAIKMRHDFFHANGCRLSDHGLKTIPWVEVSDNEAADIFKMLRDSSLRGVDNGDVLRDYSLGAVHNLQPATRYLQPETCNQKLATSLLLFLARLDHEKGWVQQFHLGALRNTNTRRLRELGADTGYDSIGDFAMAQAMAQFMNRLEEEGKLTKTILYNLNPADNEVFASMIGNFQDGSVAGKIQWGSGWWFLDQKDGMEKQINALSNFGLLSRFVGMLTDSRSFLSYPRHEYFRRILCNLIGQDVENGELPNDREWLGQMVEGICYHNARDYFNFGV